MTKEGINADPADELSLSEDAGVDHERLLEMERTCVRKLDLVIAPLIGAFNFLV